MRHGIFSEAITRFTKGQPAELSAPVLLSAVNLMIEWTGAFAMSSVVDNYPDKSSRPNIKIAHSLINDILGSNFDLSQIAKTLKDVGFEIDNDLSGDLLVKAPYWRSDIHIPEDIIEEIGRLNGFDSITPLLPMRDFSAIRPSDFDTFRTRLRKILVRIGANEVLTYSFIHGDILQRAGQDIMNSYRITNSISPDLQYYRQTLTPSLLGLVHPNIKQGYDSFALFEVNKTHQKANGLTEEGVPIESDMLAEIITNKNKQSGAAYYKAKRMLDYICKLFGVELVYEKIDAELDNPIFAPFEPRRSAKVLSKSSGLFIGVVGEYKKSVIKNFKLPEYTAGFEVDAKTLFETINGIGTVYSPISRYPATERDICFQVTQNLNYNQIINTVNAALSNVKYETLVTPVDIYQPDLGTTKNVTIRIKLVAHDRTLTSEEVTKVIDSIAVSFVNETNGSVI
jgi:phenylalanyl-tRNA synthetase beta chain